MKTARILTSTLLALVALGTTACFDYSKPLCSDANLVELPIAAEYAVTDETGKSYDSVKLTQTAKATYEYTECAAAGCSDATKMVYQLKTCKIGTDIYLEVSNKEAPSLGLTLLKLKLLGLDANGKQKAELEALALDKEAVYVEKRENLLHRDREQIDNTKLSAAETLRMLKVVREADKSIYTPIAK